jgi:hypothetical protein
MIGTTGIDGRKKLLPGEVSPATGWQWREVSRITPKRWMGILKPNW